MIDFQKVEDKIKQIKFAPEDLLLIGLMMRNFKTPASEFLKITDETVAYAYDMACTRELVEYDKREAEKQAKLYAQIIADYTKTVLQSQAFKDAVISAVLANIRERGEMHETIRRIVDSEIVH